MNCRKLKRTEKAWLGANDISSLDWGPYYNISIFEIFARSQRVASGMSPDSLSR
jgi:hypothetical protein